MTAPSSTVTAAERDLLAAVQAEEVSWRQDGGKGASYRRWSDEHEYVIVTPLAKRLVAKGLVKQEMAAGYTFINRGPIVLTREGRSVLSGANPSTPLDRLGACATEGGG